MVVGQEGTEFSLYAEWPITQVLAGDLIEMRILGFTAREMDPPAEQAVLRLIIEQVGEGTCVVDTLRILSGDWMQCMG